MSNLIQHKGKYYVKTGEHRRVQRGEYHLAHGVVYTWNAHYSSRAGYDVLRPHLGVIKQNGGYYVDTGETRQPREGEYFWRELVSQVERQTDGFWWDQYPILQRLQDTYYVNGVRLVPTTEFRPPVRGEFYLTPSAALAVHAFCGGYDSPRVILAVVDVPVTFGDLSAMFRVKPVAEMNPSDTFDSITLQLAPSGGTLVLEQIDAIDVECDYRNGKWSITASGRL